VSSYLVTRIGVHELPPFLMGGIRFVIGGALLYGFARVTGRARGGPDAAEWRRVLWVAFGCVLLSNGFNSWALQWITSNQSALLMSPAPGSAATGSLVDAAASALPPAVPPPSPYGSLVPQLGVLIGCLGGAVGTIYMRNDPSRLDMLSFTGLQMFAGGLMLLVVAAIAGDFGRWQWSPAGLAALAWLVVFSSGIAYTAYAWLSRHATPAQVGSYAFVNPALATLLGWVVLGERLGPLQWAGMFVILAGLAFIHLPARLRGTPPRE
jgi:drug/metabolite transporter (DMT)-like permease